MLVRGSNPIWTQFDLTGHLFDDTFWMFVLDNEIPYGPLPIWKDPFGNNVWNNPIRFLANGTLPNNLYFDPNTVYRLEFRQGSTQSDPLIYLVENYVPGSSGDTPIDETSFSTDNQITNPQFSLINFTSPLNLNTISSQVIQVGPGWFLHLTGTGNVTLTQELLNSTVQNNETNASYALKIELSGWDNAYLSQRFENNGVLWSNSFVSSVIMALSGNAPQNISATLVDSQGATLTSVLEDTALTSVFNAYPGIGQIFSSSNTDFPPPLGNAYIEYRLKLPNNCNITISSVQLISGDVAITYPYEQDTIERQIDQTYHTAYPIVPVGTVIDYYGFGTPLHYLPCNNMVLNRLTYNKLFNALTNVETVTLTSGLTSFTVANGNIYAINHPLEGIGVQAGSLIASIVGNVVTMNLPATANGAQSIRFFSTGNGDGSTTFNTPQLTDCVIAGTGGTLLATKGAGTTGGAASVSLVADNLPPHVHPPGSPGDGFIESVSGGIGSAGLAAGNTVFASSITNANVTAHVDVGIVQPTRLANKMIRYE